MQAWQSGKVVEEEDVHLEEARKNIDDVLDEVINYQFQTCNPKGPCESLHSELFRMSGLREDSIDCEEEFLTLKLDKESVLSSSPVPDEREQEMNLQDLESKIESIGEKKSFVSKFKKMNLQSSYPSTSKISSTPNVHGDPHLDAMQAILDILKNVENIEKLYPSLSALTRDHKKYKDVKFQRNLQAMILWLRISKDLHHKVYAMAEWIDIDPDDMLTWHDWFQHGLSKNCFLKVECQRYYKIFD